MLNVLTRDNALYNQCIAKAKTSFLHDRLKGSTKPYPEARVMGASPLPKLSPEKGSTARYGHISARCTGDFIIQILPAASCNFPFIVQIDTFMAISSRTSLRPIVLAERFVRFSSMLMCEMRSVTSLSIHDGFPFSLRMNSRGSRSSESSAYLLNTSNGLSDCFNSLLLPPYAMNSETWLTETVEP